VIRLPAFCAGILTVAATYAVSRIVFDKRSALLTSALIASSPLLILYSTNARGYMLICLAFLTLYGLGTALLRRNTPAQWLLFTIVSAAGFHTIPVMLYPFGIIVVWLCISVIVPATAIDRPAFLKNLLISLAAVAVLSGIAYMPIMIVSGFESLMKNRFVTPLPWTTFITNIASYLYSVWVYWNKDLPAWITLPSAAGFIASCIFYRRVTAVSVPIVLAVPIWSIALLLVQRVMPHQRVWLFLVPLYFSCASAGIIYLLTCTERTVSRHARPTTFLNAAVTAMISLWLCYAAIQTQCVSRSGETGTLPDAEKITLFMKDYLQPGDTVYAPCPSDSPLAYYFTLHNVPLEYLSPTTAVNHMRIVVIVNHHAQQKLESVLDRANLTDSTFGIPKIIKQYESATVYEMMRNEV
jgi:uncharacterized membrane protein